MDNPPKKNRLAMLQNKTPKTQNSQNLGKLPIWGMFINPLISIYTYWWFQTFFPFHKWDNTPIWLIFIRGVETTNQYNQYIYIYIHFRRVSYTHGVWNPWHHLATWPMNTLQKWHVFFDRTDFCLSDSMISALNLYDLSPFLPTRFDPMESMDFPEDDLIHVAKGI